MMPRAARLLRTSSTLALFAPLKAATSVTVHSLAPLAGLEGAYVGDVSPACEGGNIVREQGPDTVGQ